MICRLDFLCFFSVHYPTFTTFPGKFLSATPEDQQRREMEVTFYSRCCIVLSGVGTLSRKSRLTLAVVVELLTIVYILWF